jgi:hypothetical protein
VRHSFVSLLSDSGVPIEEISRHVGHKSTVVTEPVYRKQLRPVIQSGATVMDRLFAPPGWQSDWHGLDNSKKLQRGLGEQPPTDVWRTTSQPVRSIKGQRPRTATSMS